MQPVEPLLLDLPAEVETARLRLCVPRPGQGAIVHEALSESLAELRRFLASIPWVAAEPSVERSEIYCRNSQANFLARRDFPFLAFERETGALVGACGLHRPDWTVPKVEVGYWVRTTASGNGFVREAVDALVRYAFEHLRAQRIELVTDEENAPSRRVADASGFTLEGVLRRERRAPDGTLRNTCMYARFPDNA